MNGHRVVVIGTSAGGVEALRELAAAFPDDFPLPVCLVMHLSPQSPSILPTIIARSGALAAVRAEDGAPLNGGTIYVAPPDHHLVLEPGRLCLTRGPRENRFRPAIDPLFRSAAEAYGPGAIGVILTGSLDDGTAGLMAIKRLGGVAIVQDPEEAQFPSMPRSAVGNVAVDHIVPLAEIGPLLVRLAAAIPIASSEVEVSPLMEIENAIARGKDPIEIGLTRLAQPSSFACPECHGVLMQMPDAGMLRFRCHTGHAYSLESLLSAIDDGVDAAMWTAIRALEEAGLLMSRAAEHLEARHRADDSTARVKTRAAEARRQAAQLRTLLTTHEPLSEEDMDDAQVGN